MRINTKGFTPEQKERYTNTPKMRILTVNLPFDDVQIIDHLVHANRQYNSRTEFIREAVRARLHNEINWEKVKDQYRDELDLLDKIDPDPWVQKAIQKIIKENKYHESYHQTNEKNAE